MSILKRFAQSRHLSEEVLVEIWSAAAVEGRAGTHPHLTSCAECRHRYDRFTAWLDGIRDEAHGEAEDAFPPERLAAQQTHIFRRLEALERPARVIAFPRGSRPAVQTHRVAQRWIATAAAAGLVVGLAAGQILDLGRALQRSSHPSQTTIVSNAERRGPTPINTVVPIDEAFLYGDLDASTRSVRDISLRVIDDFTPRARDIER